MRFLVLATFEAVIVCSQAAGQPANYTTKDTICGVCEEVIQQEIATASRYSVWLKQQVQLGAFEDDAAAQELLTNLKRKLAAFQGGLIPALPAAPKTALAVAARGQYRKLLETEIDLARRKFERSKTERELGIGSMAEAMPAELHFLDLQLEAAAFDTGLWFPARTRSLGLGVESKDSRTQSRDGGSKAK